jgi:hypothetical protein
MEGIPRLTSTAVNQIAVRLETMTAIFVDRLIETDEI